MFNKLMFIALGLSMGSAALADIEINRRNFVTLNRDVATVDLVVRYPGSRITEVCGLELRTNIPVFANTHLSAFLNEVTISAVDAAGTETYLTPTQDFSEPPYVTVEQPENPSVTIRLRAPSGQSLRAVVQSTVRPSDAERIDREPEIIVVAKHCAT